MYHKSGYIGIDTRLKKGVSVRLLSGGITGCDIPQEN